MELWSLPISATIGSVEYPINANFRDILDIFRYAGRFEENIYTHGNRFDEAVGRRMTNKGVDYGALRNAMPSLRLPI